MPDLSGPITEAVFIDSPRDARIKALYDHWNAIRGGRTMPARADFDPAAIPRLLPHIILYGVGEDGGYTIRLVGEEVAQFVGRNAAGSPAGATMPPRAAAMLKAILDAVTSEGAPKFRAGKAHWHPDRDHRAFEACFLPLAAEGGRVNTVLGGVVFPEATN
jgi:hypothetical protein